MHMPRMRRKREVGEGALHALPTHTQAVQVHHAKEEVGIGVTLLRSLQRV